MLANWFILEKIRSEVMDREYMDMSYKCMMILVINDIETTLKKYPQIKLEDNVFSHEYKTHSHRTWRGAHQLWFNDGSPEGLGGAMGRSVAMRFNYEEGALYSHRVGIRPVNIPALPLNSDTPNEAITAWVGQFLSVVNKWYLDDLTTAPK